MLNWYLLQDGKTIAEDVEVLLNDCGEILLQTRKDGLLRVLKVLHRRKGSKVSVWVTYCSLFVVCSNDT